MMERVCEVQPFYLVLMMAIAVIGSIAIGVWVSGKDGIPVYPGRVNVKNVTIPDRLLDMRADELLDETLNPHRELAQIEKALCLHCGCQFDDGSANWSYVAAAVREGRGWNDLLMVVDEVAHWRSANGQESLKESHEAANGGRGSESRG